MDRPKVWGGGGREREGEEGESRQMHIQMHPHPGPEEGRQTMRKGPREVRQMRTERDRQGGRELQTDREYERGPVPMGALGG